MMGCRHPFSGFSPDWTFKEKGNKMKTRSTDSTRNNTSAEQRNEDWTQRQWIAACPKPQRLQRPIHPAHEPTVARCVHALRTGTVRAPKVLAVILILAANCALAF